MSEKKTNKSEKHETVTLDELKALILRGQEESRVQNDQILHRLEGIFTANPNIKSTKKAVTKKEKDEVAPTPVAPIDPKVQRKEIKKYSDTHFWFIGEYLHADYKHIYTAGEYEQAAATVDAVKEKSPSFNRDKAIGNALWGTFTKAKRSGELKTMFANWKTNILKIEARIIAEETRTDDDDDGDDNGATGARAGKNNVSLDEVVDPDA